MSKLIEQIIPADYFNTINNTVSILSELNLRTKLGREQFNEILWKIVKDPNNIYYMLVYEEELKNDAKYIKNIWDIMLENKAISTEILEQNKLIKKSYSKSWLYIKSKEEKYILDGNSLSITDLWPNLENLYTYGLFDGLLKKYAVTKEQLSNYPMQSFIREVRYSKRPVRKILSMWAVKDLSNQTLEPWQISMFLNNPRSFIWTANDVKNKLSTVKKINDKIEMIIKYYVMYNLAKMKDEWNFDWMEVVPYAKKLKEEIDKKWLTSLWATITPYLSIENSIIDPKWPVEYAKFFSKIKLDQNDMYISYKELLDKEVILQDLRTTRAREHLVSFIDYVKNNLIAWAETMVFRPDRNLLARKIRNKDYVEEHPKYKELTKEVVIKEINLW